MSYFYSEQITYCECIMPRQIGWEVINQLGQMQCVHFQQKQINYENPYTKSLKRCDQAIGKVNQIKNFINQIKPKFKLMKVNSYRDLLRQFNKDIKHQKIHGHLYINQIEDEIKSVHQYLSRQKKQIESLQKDLHQKLQDLALFVTLSNSQDFKSICRQKSMLDGSNLFDFKCILLNRKDQINFQKSLFRVSRGNTWTKILNIDTQSIKNAVHKQFQFLNQKVACIIMFEFGQNNVLINKITRYLACMQTKHVTQAPQKWQAAIKQLQAQIKQIQSLQSMIHDAIQRYLHKLYQPYGSSQYSYLTYLQAYALKQRQIYRRLASTNQSKNFLHFNIYIPTKSLPLKLSLNQKLPPLTLTPKQSHKQKPTKFDTNQILQIPQQILNTYGIPSYGQFNPAIFYIITFGFFIGVMFGDVGHMLMAIPFLIYFKVNKWAWTVIFFMGYCGIIYNQFFGLNLGLFQSCYRFAQRQDKDRSILTRQLGCVYPLGIDSGWKGAQNSMQFINSLKMKLAVILGVAHMLLGIGIRILNTVRRKNWLSLMTLAIPQLIFMLCTFFYMDVLILKKWLTDYTGPASKNAPSIIATMISVFAGFGDSPPQFWDGERKLQKFLVIFGYTMIPIMLFGLPLGTYIQRKRTSSRRNVGGSDQQMAGFNQLIDQKIQHQGQNRTGSQDGMSDRNPNDFPKKGQRKGSSHFIDHSHKQPMSQIFVHSFIETIEYVLGTVSNTASYLRLWALSLAHGQLSQVIFSLILKSSISGGYTSIIGAFFAFMFYYTVTFGVLICMDSMECFLHSLRLHWVEFQNKFYQGKGYKFEPFNFKLIYSK